MEKENHLMEDTQQVHKELIQKQKNSLMPKNSMCAIILKIVRAEIQKRT